MLWITCFFAVFNVFCAIYLNILQLTKGFKGCILPSLWPPPPPRPEKSLCRAFGAHLAQGYRFVITFTYIHFYLPSNRHRVEISQRFYFKQHVRIREQETGISNCIQQLITEQVMWIFNDKKLLQWIKGTVSRDFLDSVFFIILLLLVLFEVPQENFKLHFTVGCPLSGGRGEYKQYGLRIHPKQLRETKLFIPSHLANCSPSVQT